MKQFLRLTYLVLCWHFGVCQDKEVDCPDAPVDKDNIQFDLYYDAGTDINHQQTVDLVLAQLCLKIFDFQNRITVSFKPGAAAYEEHGVLVCENNLLGDCTIPMIHACARSFLSENDFTHFVCCTVNQPPNASIQCAVSLGAKEKQMNECVMGYKAGDTLLGNTIDLGNRTSKVVVDTYPAPLFEGVYTSCLAAQSRQFLVNTICKQLKHPRPSACPTQ